MWPLERAKTDSVWASTERSSPVSRTAHGSGGKQRCWIIGPPAARRDRKPRCLRPLAHDNHPRYEISSLPESALNERVDARNVPDEVLGDIVAAGEVRGGVVAHQYLAVAVAPDQNLQRQVKREQRRGHHERGAGPRTAEDQKLGLLHLEAGLLRRAAVVDERELLEALLAHRLPKPLQRLRDRGVGACLRHDTFFIAVALIRHSVLLSSIPPPRIQRPIVSVVWIIAHHQTTTGAWWERGR